MEKRLKNIASRSAFSSNFPYRSGVSRIFRVLAEKNGMLLPAGEGREESLIFQDAAVDSYFVPDR